MMCENPHQSSAMRSINGGMAASPSSLPSTPNFVRKFHTNFRPLDLRKLTLYGSPIQTSSSIPVANGSGNIHHQTSEESPSGSYSSTQSTSSSVDSSPKFRHFGSCHSQDSFILKRQSSQTRLRESLLSSLLLSPRTKEIEFTVPQTLSPLTPTFGRKGITSGDSSPGSLSGSRSETDPSNSRANTPSPVFFRGSGSDLSGACGLGGLNPELYKLKPEVDDDEDREDSQYGRVWYALEYDTTSERLLVTVIKAKRLLARGTSLSTSATSPVCCNPYARVSLFPDERRTLLSKAQRMTNNPQFDETFGFQISRASVDERSVKICFHDVDQNKKHMMLGYVIQPLKDMDWSFGKQVFKEDLVRDIGELSPNIGEVSVSLCYNANISRLTVTLSQARGIKSRESASGLYAKISLTQHTKIIKTKKTSTVALLGCRSSFNESFNFKLPAELLDTASISIQLMYAQPGYNKDQSAGRIVLGSFMFARGKGLEHWTEMLSKQKEQVQYWHPATE